MVSYAQFNKHPLASGVALYRLTVTLESGTDELFEWDTG